MDYLKPSDFKQLKAFFLALQQSHFNLKQTSTTVIVNGVPTPVDKAHCLELLRSFSDLQGEEFKDDNFLIKYLSKPDNIKRILGRLTTAQQIELTKALEEKPPAVEVTGEQPGSGETSAEQGVPTQTPVGTATGTMGMPGLPSAPSIFSAPRITRIIHNIPQTPEPSKPEIAIANSSGVVREVGDPPKLVKATRSGRIPEPGQPSKLVTANKSGAIQETPSGSKLVTANKSGILKGLGEEAPTKQIFIADKSGLITGVRNITSPGWLKTFGSNAQIFVKKNLGRIGRGLGGIAGGVGRGIAGPMLNGVYSGLGKMGTHGLNAFERLSSPGLRGASRSLASSGSKKLIWGLLGAFLFLVIGTGLIGGLSGTTPSGAAAPVVGGPSYTGGGAGIVSCPLNNGKISCGSRLSGHPYCNHCGSGYEPYTCPADAGTGRDTAIDVVGSNKSVFLPYIEGASVQWTIDEAGTAVPTSEGGGIAISANTKVGEKSYRIRLVHITSTNLAVGQQISSGTLIGQYGPDTSHVHITLQENSEFKPADTYFKLCTK